MTGTTETPLLSLQLIDKRFGSHQVLSAVSMQLAQGEIHALLGENGAGKSTLMNILTGVYSADQGQIQLRGEPLLLRKPADSATHGIGMVHQHFRLVDSFTVAENLLLALPADSPIRSRNQARQKLLDVAQQIGLNLDPDKRIDELSVAEKQRAEICKVLSSGARILILDEPTAVLTDKEAQTLLAAIRRMTEQNLSIILITHKLREVVGFSHRVTIMRRGQTVLSNAETKNLSIAEISAQMMGDQPPPQRNAPVPLKHSNADLLAINQLSVQRRDGGKGVDNLNLRVRSGEILGIAGVGGNGQSELAEAIGGTLPATSGSSIMIDGTEAIHLDVAARRRLGLRIVPADRMNNALISAFSVASNLAISRIRNGSYGRFWLSRRRIRDDATDSIEQHDIHGATAALRTGLLSGGNAQKVVLARELEGDVKLLIAHSPTRGLDVHACTTVHHAIRQAVAGGAACLLISEDLEEVLSLSDRIAVLSGGEITGELPGNTNADAVGRLILGHA